MKNRFLPHCKMDAEQSRTRKIGITVIHRQENNKGTILNGYEFHYPKTE